jgi:hypothetical protein
VIDLIEREPDSWAMFEPDGYPASIHFYYGVQDGALHKLPMGAHFGVVRSPNVYVHEHSLLRPWSYVVFEVALFQFRPGRGVERSYKQVKDMRRALTRFEVPHFEELWTEIVLNGKKKAG